MVPASNYPSIDEMKSQRIRHAKIISEAGGILNARQAGLLPRMIDTSVSEALILGLILQGVRNFICVFGHGSTELAEVLRIYQEYHLVKVFQVRSEIEASHAASALRWLTGEKAAVITSIGPGALHALAASLVPASNGIGVWYLLADETMEDEGPNMQQIPGSNQMSFLKLYSQMSVAYSLHTPMALPTALRRGLNTVDSPHWSRPYFLLLPMNIQASLLKNFNLDELPYGAPPPLGSAGDKAAYERAAHALLEAERVVVRVGGGARGAGSEIIELLELVDGVAVVAPVALGTVPHDNPRNMTVGGSKGSISGNYAMEQADLLLAVGSRAVCQSDCSRTGYPRVETVININTDPEAVMHYGKTIAMLGDAKPTLRKLIQVVQALSPNPAKEPSSWFINCQHQRKAWQAFKEERYKHPVLHDEVWGRDVLTQPAAIKVALDWSRENNAVAFFDAGDVQANGFQIAENTYFGQTITDCGASYMGFAASALLATAIATEPFYGLAFSGDGSFTMNPQILIDGVQHGVTGCILLFDNRRMAAISGLQVAQYGHEFATNDSVQVDYVAWAKSIGGVNALHAGYDPDSLRAALDQAIAYPGLSLIHIPVYYGMNELGGMGVFGRWNVGNWSENTQALRHKIGL